MNKETLDHLELCIFAEQTHDINFQNIAKELFREVYLQKSEVDRLNNIIDECAEDTLKELEENHHLSYGVALGIRQKLIDYRELKGGK